MAWQIYTVGRGAGIEWVDVTGLQKEKKKAMQIQNGITLCNLKISTDTNLSPASLDS